MNGRGGGRRIDGGVVGGVGDGRGRGEPSVFARSKTICHVEAFARLLDLFSMTIFSNVSNTTEIIFRIIV